MEQDHNTPEQSNTVPENVHPNKGSKSQKILVGFFVAVVVLLLGTIYYTWNRGAEPLAQPASEEEESDAKVTVNERDVGVDFYEANRLNEELRGTLHLTLFEPGRFDDPRVPEEIVPTSRYEYSFADDAIAMVKEGEFSGTASVRESDGTSVYTAFFPYYSVSEFPGYEAVTLGIFSDYGGETNLVSEKTTFEEGYAIDKRTPKLANTSEEVVYTAQLNPRGMEYIEPIRDLANWSIVHIDPASGTEDVLTQGAHAVWSQDDQFIFFIRNDGIYSYDMNADNAGEITSLYSTVDSLELGNQLSISENGRYLALNYFNSRTDGTVDSIIEVYEIRMNENEPELDTVLSYDITDAYAFWPVISPDGRYVVMQVAETTRRENPRLMIYDIIDERVVREIPLSDFDFDFAFLTDWSTLDS